ncbi:hypothetical protein CCUS01_10402 [Colletotrichum cuscutae]|uniref:Uncharacterized protein n=1 Tax=Colletotrichum cuscutae TaxID=1209917 RepID=A0AAI9UDH4_9PEZI|nr:hypothetical protein CCUS01_10402 [Colletotrichum cuscutae]
MCQVLFVSCLISVSQIWFHGYVVVEAKRNKIGRRVPWEEKVAVAVASHFGLLPNVEAGRQSAYFKLIQKYTFFDEKVFMSDRKLFPAKIQQPTFCYIMYVIPIQSGRTFALVHHFRNKLLPRQMSRRGIQRTGVRSEEELSIPVYTVTARDTVPYGVLICLAVLAGFASALAMRRNRGFEGTRLSHEQVVGLRGWGMDRMWMCDDLDSVLKQWAYGHVTGTSRREPQLVDHSNHIILFLTYFYVIDYTPFYTIDFMMTLFPNFRLSFSVNPCRKR